MFLRYSNVRSCEIGDGVVSQYSSSLRSLCGLRVSAVSFSRLGFTAEAQRTQS
jgi:hypothetical protein